MQIQSRFALLWLPDYDRSALKSESRYTMNVIHAVDPVPTVVFFPLTVFYLLHCWNRWGVLWYLESHREVINGIWSLGVGLVLELEMEKELERLAAEYVYTWLIRYWLGVGEKKNTCLKILKNFKTPPFFSIRF